MASSILEKKYRNDFAIGDRVLFKLGDISIEKVLTKQDIESKRITFVDGTTHEYPSPNITFIRSERMESKREKGKWEQIIKEHNCQEDIINMISTFSNRDNFSSVLKSINKELANCLETDSELEKEALKILYLQKLASLDVMISDIISGFYDHQSEGFQSNINHIIAIVDQILLKKGNTPEERPTGINWSDIKVNSLISGKDLSLNNKESKASKSLVLFIIFLKSNEILKVAHKEWLENVEDWFLSQQQIKLLDKELKRVKAELIAAYMDTLRQHLTASQNETILPKIEESLARLTSNKLIIL